MVLKIMQGAMLIGRFEPYSLKAGISCLSKIIFYNFQVQTTMATEEEVKPAKRGRGRPPKPESEKKAAKRKVCLGFFIEL